MSQTSTTAVSSEPLAAASPLVWAGSLLAMPLRAVLMVDDVLNRPSVPTAVRPARLTFAGTDRRQGEEAL